jgi:hypothetical protein
MKLTSPKPKSLSVTLPGANRKRDLASYTYRVTYRSPSPDVIGCLMTWEVSGGRLPYQVALERTTGFQLRWHCDCADAVYRGHDRFQYQCKHIAGLMECLPAML